MREPESDAMAVGLDEAPARPNRLATRRQERRSLASALSTFTTGEVFGSQLKSDVTPFGPDVQVDGHWQSYYERACAYIDRGQYHLSVALLTRVVQQSEDHVEAWHRLGFSYGELGRTDRAIECFDRVIRLDPNRSEAWCNLGWNRLRRHDVHRAILDLLRAAEIDPESKNAWSTLGLAYRQLRKFDKAAEAYERACQASPNNEAFCLSWGICLAKSGDRGGAIRSFRRACEINRTFARAWFELLIRTTNPRDWPKRATVATTQALSNQMLPNMGTVLRRDNPVTAKREASAQERVNRIWVLVQNPVTWIVVFILAGLVYTLLGS